MKNLFYLLILAAVTGCSPSGSQLSWRQETFGHSTFTADSDYVEVSYPVAAGGRSADSINRKIADRIKTGFGLTDEEAHFAVINLSGCVAHIEKLQYRVSRSDLRYLSKR